MATEMTSEELEEALKGSDMLDAYESRNDDAPDDYVIASLRRTSGGRHFRYVETSGMDSVYAGGGMFGEWLDDEEVEAWK